MAQAPKILGLVVPSDFDIRIFRRALARGLMAEGWEPTFPGDNLAVTPAAQEDELLKLAEQAVSVSGTLFSFPDDGKVISQLGKLKFKERFRGRG